MSNFPLYDNLFSEVDTNEDLSIKEKDDFIKMIKDIDQVGCELIYVLIRVYQLENTEDLMGIVNRLFKKDQLSYAAKIFQSLRMTVNNEVKKFAILSFLSFRSLRFGPA